MAKLIIQNEEYALADGSEITGVCRSAGLVFNCNTGVCGSCLITVLDGEKNLSPLTNEEEMLGLDPQRRLACQCRINQGIVTIGF